MPTESEKRAAVQSILDQAMPVRKKRITMLFRLFKSVGTKYLFFDLADCILLSVMLSALIAAVTLFSFSEQPCLSAFAVSPVFYLTAFLLTRIKDDRSGCEQIKYTCVFTPDHLCIARSILFSIGGLIFCSLLSPAVLLIAGNAETVNIWCISLLSQLICSTVTLLSLDRKNRYLPDAAALFCLGAELLMLALRKTAFAQSIETALENISGALLTAILIFVIIAYLFAMRTTLTSLLNKSKGEVKNYA